jgi:hypothetical protein
MLVINVTQSNFPLIVEFDTCQILPCGGLMSKDIPFICAPSQNPQGSWYLSRVDGCGVKHWV